VVVKVNIKAIGGCLKAVDVLSPDCTAREARIGKWRVKVEKQG